jgi:hypothetical protein
MAGRAAKSRGHGEAPHDSHELSTGDILGEHLEVGELLGNLSPRLTHEEEESGDARQDGPKSRSEHG